MFFIIFLCIVGLTFANKEHDSKNIIEIRNGKIRGRTITSIQNKTIYLYLEIPFAQPPVGNLRFKDPLPSKNWTGILNTKENTKICMERRIDPHKDDPRQNEDCLYLNVYSPVPPGPKKVLLPVFVYVYGGQHQYGHAHYDKIDPQQFVDSDILVVTMNFRSGALGYLSTEDGVISGNRGLKDQHLALKWVQNNIHFFGGDPSKVTLVGHSSGAMCVAFHILSSKTTGLFRAAIMQSGTSLSPLSYTQRARKVAFEMGRQLSPKFSYENTSEDLLKILLEAPARKIMYMNFPHLLIKDSPMEKYFEELYFKPIIERSDIPNAYLTRLPHDSQLEAHFQRVPILTGITSEEYVYIKSLPQMPDLNRGTILLENENIKWGFRNILEERIKRLYTNSSFKENDIVKYFGDYLFHVGSIRFAELHARYANTYFYKFSYLGKINELMFKHDGDFSGLDKVGHCEELPYLYFFHGNASEFYKFPAPDLLMQKKLIKVWTNFIKYMNPTPNQEFLTDYIKWPKVSEDGFTYVDINSKLTIVKDFPRSLYRKWLTFVQDYYKHPLGWV